MARWFPRIVVMVMVGFGSFVASYGAKASDTPAGGEVDRANEGVVVEGSSIADFAGTPVGDLFVYAFNSGVWAQIPFQVDEVQGDGTYVANENGTFDENDEIVFMARDAGDQLPGEPPTDERLYEVEITDPLQPATKGWVYIVQSDTLRPDFTGDYVTFTAATRRINGDTYQVGWSAGDLFLDYTTLGTGPDILDRLPKLRGCAGTVCLTENQALINGPTGFELVKDGVVRVIVEGSSQVLQYQALAYDTNITWYTGVTATGVPITDLRSSADFTPEAVGSTYYNAVVPGGRRIDGIPDTVPATPVSDYWQVSTEDGTIVQAVNLAPAANPAGTSTFANYYVDNALVEDPTDTTDDKRHYGETGYTVTSPSTSFTYRFDLYFLPGRQPNVGTTYLGYFDNPLATEYTPLNEPVSNDVYLPLVITGE
jgi:hypothetical protein